jgi:hypothetical protein
MRRVLHCKWRSNILEPALPCLPCFASSQFLAVPGPRETPARHKPRRHLYKVVTLCNFNFNLNENLNMDNYPNHFPTISASTMIFMVLISTWPPAASTPRVLATLNQK